jgi:E3 ubiquitin-protein ligase SIAH1
MEGVRKGSKLVKEGGDGQQEGEGIVVKKQNVAMGMDVLDCPGCSTPLRPPIFQVMDCDWCFLPDYSH